MPGKSVGRMRRERRDGMVVTEALVHRLGMRRFGRHLEKVAEKSSFELAAGPGGHLRGDP